MIFQSTDIGGYKNFSLLVKQIESDHLIQATIASKAEDNLTIKSLLEVKTEHLQDYINS